jgi:large subunit ribosomal protein L25
MKSIEIEVTARMEMTKNELGRFRNEGKVPAILYGRHIEKNIPLYFDAKSFSKILTTGGRSTILVFKSNDPKLNGTSALIKEVQRHAITDMFLNVDLIEIRKGEKITLSIPIEYVGVPEGAKQGGVVDIQRRELKIECLPTDIPENIKIDISNMNLNDVMHVADLKVENNIKVMDDKSFSLISVKVVKEKVEAVATPAEGEVAAAEGAAPAEGAAAAGATPAAGAAAAAKPGDKAAAPAAAKPGDKAGAAKGKDKK